MLASPNARTAAVIAVAARTALAALAACVAPGAAQAQISRRVAPSPAEAAIARGRLDVAEDALYDAVARAPHEPSARGALGAFLAARGRFLVGATLLDEALHFGADSAAVQELQGAAYRWMGEYGRAAALDALRLPVVAREAYRRAGAGVVSGAPLATVELQPNDASGLGRIVIAVNGVPVTADVQPVDEGLQLPSSPALLAAVEAAGVHGDTTWGVARAVTIGGVTYGPVPVSLVSSLAVARVGLDVLSRLVPTFDDCARTLTVRSTGRAPPGEVVPVLLAFPGVRFVPADGGAPVALHTAAGRAALRDRPWTFDVAAGAIILGR